jgi:hypothetical protein
MNSTTREIDAKARLALRQAALPEGGEEQPSSGGNGSIIA